MHIYLLKASFGYMFISILGYSLPHGLQTTQILFCFHGIKRMQHIINDLAAILSHTKISKTNVLYRLKIAVMGYFVLVQAYILVCKSNSKQTHKLLSAHRADPSWMKPGFIFTEKICQFAFSRQR